MSDDFDAATTYKYVTDAAMRALYEIAKPLSASAGVLCLSLTRKRTEDEVIAAVILVRHLDDPFAWERCRFWDRVLPTGKLPGKRDAVTRMLREIVAFQKGWFLDGLAGIASAQTKRAIYEIAWDRTETLNGTARDEEILWILGRELGLPTSVP